MSAGANDSDEADCNAKNRGHNFNFIKCSFFFVEIKSKPKVKRTVYSADEDDTKDCSITGKSALVFSATSRWFLINDKVWLLLQNKDTLLDNLTLKVGKVCDWNTKWTYSAERTLPSPTCLTARFNFLLLISACASTDIGIFRTTFESVLNWAWIWFVFTPAATTLWATAL